jgi:hypothetical protein
MKRKAGKTHTVKVNCVYVGNSSVQNLEFERNPQTKHKTRKSTVKMPQV